MRSFFYCLLLMCLCHTGVNARQQTALTRSVHDTVIAPQAVPVQLSVLDSVVAATRARDKFVGDSVAMQFVKYPDSSVNREFVKRTLKAYLYIGKDFLDIPFKSNRSLRDGQARQTRDPWVLAIIFILVIYTALLNVAINKDIQHVVQSFYSKRVLGQSSKEDVYINFWSFVALFLLFGFTFGLFIYQWSVYNNTYYSISGVNLFVSLSVLVLGLAGVKFIALKIIGFIFDINKLVSEYVSVLYLTYFNTAFIFLPVVVCFSLLNAVFIPYLLTVSLVLTIVVFAWLFMRSSLNIISNFRFHKFYLFIYLCALEICPILILIKALNI